MYLQSHALPLASDSVLIFMAFAELGHLTDQIWIFAVRSLFSRPFRREAVGGQNSR